MKIIDVEKWKRKSPYNCFKDYTNPIFSMSVRLDVTDIVEYSKKTKTSFFINFLFVVTKCLNRVENFRMRILDDKVVLFPRIDPSYIIMNEEGVIVTANTKFNDNYKEFYSIAKRDVDEAVKVDSRRDFKNSERVDLFYTTCIRWVDFLTMTNPYDLKNANQTSIPRLAWGKYVNENGRLKMTFDIAAHHALMDGYEMSLAFIEIEKALSNIEEFL